MEAQGTLKAQTRSLLGISLSRHQLEAFRWYADELLKWNERFNLTAITDPAGIEIKHFLDSLTCLLVMGRQPRGRVMDVGAGAGFPGLPIKIACPWLRLTLLEATAKKADFCQHVVSSLALPDVEVVHGRAEEVGHMEQHRQGYDWALARAVANMPVLVEYLLPFLKVGRKAVALKGESGPAEAQAAEGGLRILGGRVRRVIPVELPGIAELHYLVVVDKVAATPSAYPRRPGMPSKRPLR